MSALFGEGSCECFELGQLCRDGLEERISKGVGVRLLPKGRSEPVPLPANPEPSIKRLHFNLSHKSILMVKVG